MTEVTLDELKPRSSYVSRAFGVQYNLILLGGSGLFALALASAWPLVAGVAAELLWLGVGSNLDGVRRWLDGRNALEAELAAGSVPPFELAYRQRLRLFDQSLNELKALGIARGEPAFRRSLAGLDVLRSAFDATCRTHQGLQSFLAATAEDELTREVTRLEQAAAAALDLDAKMGIRQALFLAKRRVEQRQGMVSQLAALSLRLETVERALGYLLRQGRALGANVKLAAEIDALVGQIGGDPARVTSSSSAPS